MATMIQTQKGSHDTVASPHRPKFPHDDLLDLDKDRGISTAALTILLIREDGNGLKDGDSTDFEIAGGALHSSIEHLQIRPAPGWKVASVMATAESTRRAKSDDISHDTEGLAKGPRFTRDVEDADQVESSTQINVATEDGEDLLVNVNHVEFPQADIHLLDLLSPEPLEITDKDAEEKISVRDLAEILDVNALEKLLSARSVLEGFEELSEKQTSDTSLADRKGKEEAEPVSDSWLPDSDFGLEAQSKYIKASKGPRVVTDLVDITSDIDVSMMELNEGAGKGKGKAIESALTDRKNAEPSDIDDFIPSLPYADCGICLEAVSITFNPFAAALTARSSTHLSFGLRMPGCDHAYCLGCMETYISGKLGDGVGEQNVFPINCPGCPRDQAPIGDEVATRIFGEEGMEPWYFQKLRDSLPKFFCPNRECSSPIAKEPGMTEAICPHCGTTLCASCAVVWHTDLTCDQYQALPEEERSPEDRATLALAKANKWARCYNCGSLAERVIGCEHITCNCKAEYCYTCESPWDIVKQRCSKDPPCQLFVLPMDLQQEIRQDAVLNAPLPRRPPAPVVRIPFAYMMRRELPSPANYETIGSRGIREWMQRYGSLNAKNHYFTGSFVYDPFSTYLCKIPGCMVAHPLLQPICQYKGCRQKFPDQRALGDHLEYTVAHPVWFCCGKLFLHESAKTAHQSLGSCGPPTQATVLPAGSGINGVGGQRLSTWDVANTNSTLIRPASSVDRSRQQVYGSRRITPPPSPKQPLYRTAAPFARNAGMVGNGYKDNPAPARRVGVVAVAPIKSQQEEDWGGPPPFDKRWEEIRGRYFDRDSASQGQAPTPRNQMPFGRSFRGSLGNWGSDSSTDEDQTINETDLSYLQIVEKNGPISVDGPPELKPTARN